MCSRFRDTVMLRSGRERERNYGKASHTDWDSRTVVPVVILLLEHIHPSIH